MENQLKISIPTPCHENLGQMDKTDNGRFCLSCQKEVIDFTKMSDEDMILYFERKKSSAPKVCGTFRVNQVLENKKMIEIPIQTYFKAKTSNQRFLWMLFACMGMWFVSCNSKTNGEVQISVVDSSINDKDEDTTESQEMNLTGDTIYSNEPIEKPKKIEPVETITGELSESVTGFVAPPLKGGCVIPENIEEETTFIKGKVAFPADTVKQLQLDVPKKDTAIKIKRKPDNKFIGLKQPSLFND